MKKTVIVFACIFILDIGFINVNAADAQINVNARCAAAMDCKSKILLYDKNARMIVPMASTTKIMTALVAIKYGKLDKAVEISKKASNVRGSKAGYKKGEKITIKELLYGLMLRSGNDAAIAIAEGTSGSVDEFLKLMNEYALEIGTHDTHYESPHGLDSENHYSTAYDLALVAAKAKENDLFNKIVSSKDVDGKSNGFTRDYHNINKILWKLKDANGVKTGSTGKAGKCLVTSVNMDGNDVLIVVLNCSARWNETCKIYDYIKKNYEFKKMFSKGQVVDKIFLKNGRNKINLVCTEDIIIPMKKGCSCSSKSIKPENIYYPIIKHQNIGSILIYEDGKEIFRSKLEAQKSSSNLNIFKRLKNKLGTLIDKA